MLGFQIHPTIDFPRTLKNTKDNPSKTKSLIKPNDVKFHMPFLLYCMIEIETFVPNKSQQSF
jgi:hypothetical protein